MKSLQGSSYGPPEGNGGGPLALGAAGATALGLAGGALDGLFDGTPGTDGADPGTGGALPGTGGAEDDGRGGATLLKDALGRCVGMTGLDNQHQALNHSIVLL